MTDIYSAAGVLIVWLLLCALVGRMATSYKRSAAAWFVLSLLFSPLAGFVFLVVADVPHNAIVRDAVEQQVRQRHPEQQDIRQIVANDMNCPNCGATVNPMTGEGLHSPESEPWLLICNQCQSGIEPDV